MEENQKIYKILLVEDDKFLLDMYATKFKERGFDVTAVFCGPDALSKLEEEFVPDIILTDVVMPVMTGFEFLEEVRKRKFAPNARIIVLSNLGQKEDLDKGAALGADGYIIKAMSTPSEVVKKVLEVIGTKKL